MDSVEAVAEVALAEVEAEVLVEAAAVIVLVVQVTEVGLTVLAATQE